MVEVDHFNLLCNCLAITGIVASTASVIHSALMLVADHEPHFIAVIDRLRSSDRPRVYESTASLVSDCLPYLKEL